MTVKVIDTPS